MSNEKQLTIMEEAERKIRQSRENCKHVFGLPLPAYDFERDDVMYFAVCKKCGYHTD
jgi:hypothetical protein